MHVFERFLWRRLPLTKVAWGAPAVLAGKPGKACTLFAFVRGKAGTEWGKI